MVFANARRFLKSFWVFALAIAIAFCTFFLVACGDSKKTCIVTIKSEFSKYVVNADNSNGMTAEAFLPYDGTFDIIEVEEGSIIGAIELKRTTIKKQGVEYCFGGWFTDQSYTIQWNVAVDVVKGDMTLYAKWEEYSEKNLQVADCSSGHIYNAQPEFLWSSIDDSADKVTAKLTCSVDSSHIDYVECDVDKEIVSDDSSISLEERANAIVNGNVYTSRRTKTLFRWKYLYLMSSNCDDWLEFEYLNTESNKVFMSVSAKSDNFIYSDIRVTFTIDIFGAHYGQNGIGTTAVHEYKEFTLGIDEFKTETITTSFSVRSCTLYSISVSGKVEGWNAVTENWVYK